MQFTIELNDIPPGDWKRLELRHVKQGETFRSWDCKWDVWGQPQETRKEYLVLIPVKHGEPKLPDDAGKVCEFSDDGENWTEAILVGYDNAHQVYKWISDNKCWMKARIEEDK
jgi:hypothetical protein